MTTATVTGITCPNGCVNDSGRPVQHRSMNNCPRAGTLGRNGSSASAASKAVPKHGKAKTATAEHVLDDDGNQLVDPDDIVPSADDPERWDWHDEAVYADADGYLFNDDARRYLVNGENGEWMKHGDVEPHDESRSGQAMLDITSENLTALFESGALGTGRRGNKAATKSLSERLRLTEATATVNGSAYIGHRRVNGRSQVSAYDPVRDAYLDIIVNDDGKTREDTYTMRDITPVKINGSTQLWHLHKANALAGINTSQEAGAISKANQDFYGKHIEAGTHDGKSGFFYYAPATSRPGQRKDYGRAETVERFDRRFIESRKMTPGGDPELHEKRKLANALDTIERVLLNGERLATPDEAHRANQISGYTAKTP